MPVPIQRNSRKESKPLKAREIPQAWVENPHKLAKKGTDAQWTKRHNTSSFGDKDHISIDDVESGFMRRYRVTDASIHDSQALGAVLDPDNRGDEVWADRADRSEHIEAGRDALGQIRQIHERASQPPLK